MHKLITKGQLLIHHLNKKKIVLLISKNNLFSSLLIFKIYKKNIIKLNTNRKQLRLNSQFLKKEGESFSLNKTTICHLSLNNCHNNL